MARVQIVPDPRSSLRDEWADEFPGFWKAYPRKVGRYVALLSWMRLCRPDMDLEALELLLGQILTGLDWYRATEWRDRETSKIPHASTWLNQRRWEDALEG